VVNTEAEHVDIKEHRSDFDSASLWINVNISFSVLCYHIFLTLTPLLIQKIIEHSQSKDKFLRVSSKRPTETQILEDELIEVSALNKVLLAQNQELETQLAKESQEKADK
jgi:hypothetical protein